MVETKALRRSNVVKTTLLRSISHDLRTPLTAITTAAGGLRSDTISADERAELAAVIAEESARLSQMVENLLDLTRLQSGAAEPRSDWCSVEELVAAAIESVPAPAGRLRRRARRAAADPRRRRASSSARWRTCSATRGARRRRAGLDRAQRRRAGCSTCG